MSETPPRPSPPLRWWFWLVLFAPSIVFSVVAPNSPLIKSHLHGYEVWVTKVLWTFFGSLNVVCSMAAAGLIESARTGQVTARSLAWASFLFFMNVVVGFAGCVGSSWVFL